MKQSISVFLAAGLAISAALPVRASDQAVTVNFGISAGGKAIGCGAPVEDVGAAHLKATLNDARVYVHGLKLIGTDGSRTAIALDESEWQFADLALLDFKDARGGSVACSDKIPAKNTSIRGRVPTGTYTGLEFSVGVPMETVVKGTRISLNHSNLDTSPPPLDVAFMNWSWQSGRKFLAIEVNPAGGFKRADGSPGRTWMVHLGSTACTGNPATGEIVECKRPNRFSVVFDKYDTSRDVVEIDLSTLFKNSDLAKDNGGAIGCMSDVKDPECPAIFAALGLNLADADGAPSGVQTRAGFSPIFKIKGR